MSIVHVPFYPSDWLAGTRGMSAEETGVYITLVARMYEMAGPIERDDKRLSRLCGTKTRAAFVRVLEHLMSEGKILEGKDGLYNKKAQKVIQNVIGKSDKARAAAQSRWDEKPNKNKGGDYATASPEHMPEPCQPKPKPNIEEKDKSSSSKKAAEEEDYERYLEAHPKPANTGAGRYLFGQLVDSGIDPERIIAAAREYAQTVKGWSSAGKVQRSDNFLDPERGKWESFDSKPPQKPSEADVLDFYAQTVLSKKRTAPSTVSSKMAARLVAAGLVSNEDLIAAGVRP